MPEKTWRYPWQVTRCFRNGAIVAVCSHRLEVVAYWCSRLRELFAPPVDLRHFYYDTQRTPKGV